MIVLGYIYRVSCVYIYIYVYIYMSGLYRDCLGDDSAETHRDCIWIM